MNMSTHTVWLILRKKLKMFPYKPKKIQPLTQAHRNQRVTFSDWLGLKTAENPEFVDSVIWSDEKLWEEKVHSNKQNEIYWGEGGPRGGGRQ